MIFHFTSSNIDFAAPFSFDEIIISWNCIRPKTGVCNIWVKTESIDWILYASWGKDTQRTYRENSLIYELDQDVLTFKTLQKTCQVKIETFDENIIKRVSISLTNTKKFKRYNIKDLDDLLISNPHLQSQMTLNHPRKASLCSPTSLSCAINTLKKTALINPLDFCEKCKDLQFDIYGNWVLNIAQAFHESKNFCYVTRLNHFKELLDHLKNRSICVVSVKGPLVGSATPYSAGHLMCVIGYKNNKVLTIDPAFEEDLKTYHEYPLDSFLEAWARRRNLSYIIEESVSSEW